MANKAEVASIINQARGVEARENDRSVPEGYERIETDFQLSQVGDSFEGEYLGPGEEKTIKDKSGVAKQVKTFKFRRLRDDARTELLASYQIEELCTKYLTPGDRAFIRLTGQKNAGKNRVNTYDIAIKKK
jgi:hypothetical protein